MDNLGVGKGGVDDYDPPCWESSEPWRMRRRGEHFMLKVEDER